MYRAGALPAPAATVLALAMAASTVGGQRVPIESADQLPRHTYAVSGSATSLVEDDARFAALASELERDLRADLAAYDIHDPATLKGYYDTLGSLAALKGDYDGALAWADSLRVVEDKPALRALAGTLERAFVAASRVPESERKAAFETTYRGEIAALPYDRVQAEIRSLKGFIEFASPGVLLGFVRGRVESAARSGEISRELAEVVVDARVYLDVLRPYQDVIIAVLGETIATHAVVKPDIWAERDASLDGWSGLTPVRVGIWDTGVDVSLLEGRVFVNEGEVPGNGVDDDGNGFVDDVHGIAHDSDLRRTTGVLAPVDWSAEEEAVHRSRLKGFMDLLAGLDTPDAAELRHLAASLEPGEFTAFFEALTRYSNYAHGTHVAGIAVAGNPAARIVVGRITPDHRMVPELPTPERAEDWARTVRDDVDYFRDHGVRVVNMSWGSSPRLEETALELNNAGGSPEERKALARLLFGIGADALREAFRGAPGILFVAAAGNSDEDNRFAEFAPGSLDLPNLVTVAAVDRAGDEAAFTSYGRVDVYANGYEVVSYVPGGERSPMSGTSMAAPQVVNLAAKLLAIEPDLSVAELRHLIVEGADWKAIGTDRRIRLLNPARSIEMLAGRR